jgi:hypothetical protein
MPFADRVCATVDDTAQATGWGRSTVYKKMRTGEIEYRQEGRRRLVVVPSVLKRLGIAADNSGRAA